MALSLSLYNSTATAIVIDDVPVTATIPAHGNVTMDASTTLADVQNSLLLRQYDLLGQVQVTLNKRSLKLSALSLLVGAPSSGGSGVDSFNSRTGAVVPADGDYSADLISYDDSAVPNFDVLNVQEAIDAIKLVPPVIVTAAGDYTITATDRIVCINKTVGAATAVNLPSATGTGRTIDLKDAKGDADVNNITVSGDGQTIDGAASLVLVTAYAAIRLYDSAATKWLILA